VIVTDTAMAQRNARMVFKMASVGVAPVPSQVPLKAPEMPQLPSGDLTSVVGELSIPQVHLSAMVLQGSDKKTLRRGPGHLEHTAVPGEPGNVVIAGHRDTFFSPLRNIRRGDDIFLDTQSGRLHYVVRTFRVVAANDLSVVAPTREPTLTLVTCYPFWVLGNAPDRFVVRAEQVAGLTPVPVKADVQPTPGAVDAVLPPRSTPIPPRAKAFDGRYNNETLIRDAVEHFRVTYNGRLVSRNDVRPGGLLVFRTCDLDIGDVSAEAKCETPLRSTDDRPKVWTLILKRDDIGWSIVSVQSP
jgi:LPXTG-site transpeptidase (sortase) family protein